MGHPAAAEETLGTRRYRRSAGAHAVSRCSCYPTLAPRKKRKDGARGFFWGAAIWARAGTPARQPVWRPALQIRWLGL